jgi:hypothetical protein
MTGASSPRRLAAATVFPGLVALEVIANQPWWIGGIQPGQPLTWLLIAILTAIVFLTPALGRWARVLVGLIFAAKLGAWLTGQPGLDALYRVALVGSSGVVGAILILEYRPMLRRQAAVMMIAAMPLMLLQVVGAGAWTQVLTTHGIMEDGESVSKEGMPTLFVPQHELRTTNVQMRPAGFFHASEYASLIIIFCFVLIITSPAPRTGLAGLAVCVAAVVSMAKIVLGVTALVAVFLMITGTAELKRRAALFAAGLVALVFAYWILFPGLFESNLGMEAIALSLLSRAYDVAGALGYGAVIDRQLYEVFHQAMELSDHTFMSGLGQIMYYLPLFAAALAVGIPAGILAFVRMRRLSPSATRFAATALMAITLFIIAGPFLGSPSFWFCMGAGMFPFLALLDRAYLMATFGRVRASLPATALSPPPAHAVE